MKAERLGDGENRKVELEPAVVLSEQDYGAASLRKTRKKEARKLGRWEGGKVGKSKTEECGEYDKERGR